MSSRIGRRARQRKHKAATQRLWRLLEARGWLGLGPEVRRKPHAIPKRRKVYGTKVYEIVFDEVAP